MAEARRLTPRPTDVSRPYWDACGRGELVLQQCGACRQFQFYPRLLCSHCGGRDLVWQKVSGEGRIASFTVVRRGVSAAYPSPYVVALIDLSEGPRMMSSVIDVEPKDPRLAVGAVVEVEFVEWVAQDGDTPTLEEDQVNRIPVFRLSHER